MTEPRRPCVLGGMSALLGGLGTFTLGIGLCWVLGGRLVPWLGALLLLACGVLGAVAGRAVGRRLAARRDDASRWAEFERQFWEYVRAQKAKRPYGW